MRPLDLPAPSAREHAESNGSGVEHHPEGRRVAEADLDDIAWRERPGEAEPLDLIASELHEPADLIVVLDAFGDDVELECARETD